MLLVLYQEGLLSEAMACMLLPFTLPLPMQHKSLLLVVLLKLVVLLLLMVLLVLLAAALVRIAGWGGC